ncbi:hypothetical protein RCL_jg3958.t1 [Rhizophagus clarus]|uniref:Uncharacterized protein n=1 Tax=Rhizophagus clarus TaxID=94130 RepID=A0A8H3KPH9_9GLOM|nr:hypothetical protein RCL_jg3958.t1 [Rhizophagus clarus]
MGLYLFTEEGRRGVLVAYSSDLDMLDLDNFSYSNIYGCGFCCGFWTALCCRIFGLIKNTRTTESFNKNMFLGATLYVRFKRRSDLLTSCEKFDSQIAGSFRIGSDLEKEHH